MLNDSLSVSNEDNSTKITVEGGTNATVNMHAEVFEDNQKEPEKENMTNQPIPENPPPIPFKPPHLRESFKNKNKPKVEHKPKLYTKCQSYDGHGSEKKFNNLEECAGAISAIHASEDGLVRSYTLQPNKKEDIPVSNAEREVVSCIPELPHKFDVNKSDELSNVNMNEGIMRNNDMQENEYNGHIENKDHSEIINSMLQINLNKDKKKNVANKEVKEAADTNPTSEGTTTKSKKKVVKKRKEVTNKEEINHVDKDIANGSGSKPPRSKSRSRIDQKLEFQYKENILQGCQKLPEEPNTTSTETFDDTHDKRATENKKPINSKNIHNTNNPTENDDAVQSSKEMDGDRKDAIVDNTIDKSRKRAVKDI